MVARLAEELRMTRAFACPEEEAMLSVVRTAEVLAQRVASLLKSFDLSANQYNVLRILRGSSETGLTCGQIGERMISRDPDITRLLDRLESRQLIARQRSDEDRRVVVSRITPAGLSLLREMDPEILSYNKQCFKNFGAKKLRQLIELLEQARADVTGK
ncbi:MAG TPA: MarR family transcriptional regulator [Bryobacteraceae bacterium]|jgi:DNA-binding MarR family transcriptional regulator|nr:MarR family transcriptional regulator [Bryobacteraceae bacterium]